MSTKKIERHLVFYYRQRLLFTASMDDDTIFPALSNGERIMGKYRDTACRQCVVTIAIVTNFRLLIRWKQRICFCFSRSYYSSILLDSIDRIDETRSNRDRQILGFITGLLSGLVATILGFALKVDWLKWIGIALIISIAIPFLIVFFCFKKKFITVKGSFGTETMRFERKTARQLEAQLSEMIHQRRVNGSSQQGNWHGPPPSTLSSPIAPVYFVEPEMRQMKKPNKYVYDPSTEYF
jgi:hypothetical protein